MSKLTVFYPWIEKAAKWQELRYSLRSIEKNFKQEVEVVICSPEPATFLKPETYRHLPQQRVQPNTPASPSMFDVGRKLLRASIDPLISDPFLMVHDDFFFLKKTKMRDLESYLTLVMDSVNAPAVNRDNPFIESLWRASQILSNSKMPTWNPCLHLPRLMNKKASEMAAKVCCETGANWEMLYFNYTLGKGKRVSFYSKTSNLKAGFYGADNLFGYHVEEGDTLASVSRIIEPRQFLSFNDKGFDPIIAEYLENKFPEKSRWES
jgi:hypothetical protein